MNDDGRTLMEQLRSCPDDYVVKVGAFLPTERYAGVAFRVAEQPMEVKRLVHGDAGRCLTISVDVSRTQLADALAQTKPPCRQETAS
jgi:hypothetical protein